MKNLLPFLLYISLYQVNAQLNYDPFLSLVYDHPEGILEEQLGVIDKEWVDTSPIMAIEVLYLVSNPMVKKKLYSILQSKTGKNYGEDYNAWYDWWWSQKVRMPKDYLDFKSHLYSLIDSPFYEYFAGRGDQTLIEPTEIRWGGVAQDGIPPLRGPNMIKMNEADYLEDDNVVFGLFIEGEARAYPKRILAWHEMFVDEISGIVIAGVYCTLCGTVIAYDAQDFSLGTSGFLYRSNKLMYDQNTQSLWSTLDGKPVVGPLIEEDIQLEYYPIVTTTWGKWKNLHPETLVLSLNTGHNRDYNEGAAYKDYFAVDGLMFTVKDKDSRLANKDEVLVFKSQGESLAISTRFLNRNKVYYDKVGSQNMVILTDESGANRAYKINGRPISKFRKGDWIDSNDQVLVVSEEFIQFREHQFERVPAYRAFWFGWFAANPTTRLVK